MAIPHDDLTRLVVEVFGDTRVEVAAGLAILVIYKADPDTLDRLLRLMKEDGFNFPEGAEEIAALLKQKMDELETLVEVK